MAIPRSQLDSWSSQGATTLSSSTYTSIRTALEQYNWPSGMNYNAYLQGSYPNHTNIRGDSDVDVVVQSDAVFYSNLTDAEKRTLNISIGGYTFSDFKVHVIAALRQYFGYDLVTIGRKSLKIPATSNRLAADIIPCIAYKRFRSNVAIALGMTFWTADGIQIINYPKLHIANGAAKNTRCRDLYKPSVRIFKNARNTLPDPQQYPSYFVECLMYNLDDDCYNNDLSSSFYECLCALFRHVNNNTLSTMVTGSQQQLLFGDSETQWNINDAERLINELVRLWNG